MNEIIEDLFKIYKSCIDSYNSKIHQTINDKYAIIDKSMLTVYLYVKIMEDRKEQNKQITEVLANYLLRQIIYGETGSLVFEIDESKQALYSKMLDKLVLEKFEYKNRIMQKLKYNYKNIELNKYKKLLVFLENIAEFAIFEKMLLRGNKEVESVYNYIKNKIIEELKSINNNDDFYEEKRIIINLIKDDKFNESKYGNLMHVALNLKDVYRYSSFITVVPENVLFHQYTIAVTSLIFAEYCNKELKENIDIYTIIVKSLFHDFGEYKGTEIVTQFKNYNDVTKKMFAEIEEKDEKELETKIGANLYFIISNYKKDAEGFISEILDKMLGIMKLWIETEDFNNYTSIRGINSVFQDRFKRFLEVKKIDKLKEKDFYLGLLREVYIFIKEHLVEKDLNHFFNYFTKEDLEMYRNEIELLKNSPEEFLK